MTAATWRVPGRLGPGLLLAATILSGCASTGGPRPELVAGADWSGLEPIPMKGMDIAYARPGVDFGAYQELLLEPVEVELAPEWEPLRSDSRASLPPRVIEELHEDVAAPLRDGFAKSIERGGKYQLVGEPGPGVLRVRVRVVDVRLNAPDLRTPGRTERWAKSFGEMTLVAELVDVDSGALVARIMDRWVDPDGAWQRYTRVDNSLAIGRAAEDWAGAIRRHLEVAGIRNRMQGIGEGLKKADPD